MATNIDKGIYQAPAGLDSMRTSSTTRSRSRSLPTRAATPLLDPEALALIAQQGAKSAHGDNLAETMSKEGTRAALQRHQGVVRR